MPLLLDTESRSRCDLKAHGGRLYWEHPSTEMLCCVAYDTDTQLVDVWRRGDPIPWWAFTEVQLGAHNAMGFDRFALAREWGVPIDTPWIDTSEFARRAGLPGALDALGTRWLGLPKDKAASKFTASLSTVRRPSGKNNPNAIPAPVWATFTKEQKRERGVQREITADDLERVVSYGTSDVEIMAHGWPLLAEWAGLEPDVERVDRIVNDRGVYFDAALARRLIECDARVAELACAAVAAALGQGWTAARVRTVARSDSQFPEHTGLPNAQAATVQEALDQAGAPWHRPETAPLCRARQALASIARGKLEAGLARVSSDGRIRDSLRYYGAHTGRWSGRGIQPQNLPRPAKRFDGWIDDQICALADRVMAGAWADADEIDLLVRACFTAPAGRRLVWCDFAGVEARALAWCANDVAALDVFASGVSPYKVIAAKIFGGTADDYSKGDPLYTAGKVSELACGYGGGVNALEKMARGYAFDFASAGVDPMAVVQGWRDAHAPIVQFWRDLEAAFGAAVRGETSTVDRFTLSPSEDGRAVAAWLPSGRPIVYNDVRIGRDPKGRPRLMFRGTKHVEDTYGGKLTENVIQALCRDLMADALVRAEDAGLEPVLHVHDEIVCEVDAGLEREGLDELRRIMLTVPEWAQGFPIGAEGGSGRRSRK